jgi:hypothetical protein
MAGSARQIAKGALVAVAVAVAVLVLTAMVASTPFSPSTRAFVFIVVLAGGCAFFAWYKRALSRPLVIALGGGFLLVAIGAWLPSPLYHLAFPAAIVWYFGAAHYFNKVAPLRQSRNERTPD